MKVTTIIYIVGDKFEHFSKHEGVYTFTSFINLLSDSEKKFKCDFLVLGQGLDIEEKNILKALVKHAEIGCIQEPIEPLASTTISHKHQVKNIMISEPFYIESKNSYKSCLVLNDDCAEMSDHVTGQHIQGMVLTEAARQMMLAVAEKYILKDCEKDNSYCALLKVTAHFKHFGFPISTQIFHEILELSNDKPGKYKARTNTTFIQNNKIITSVEIDYLFNDKKMLYEKEEKMAYQVLSENRVIYSDSQKLPFISEANYEN